VMLAVGIGIVAGRRAAGRVRFAVRL